MENIRKVLSKKKNESGLKCRELSGIAIDCNYEDSIRIRKSEKEEWKKFEFFNGLLKAMDKGDMKENES